jgi:hypothetical protein
MEDIKMISVNTKEIVPFHFLLLAVGEVLKINDYVTAQKVQDFIQNDDAFGVRPPLEECRLALILMEGSGFIKNNHRDEYVWKSHPVKHGND